MKNLDRSISSHCSTIRHDSEVDVGIELRKNEVEESEEEQIASAEKQSMSVDAISSSQKHSIVLEVTFDRSVENIYYCKWCLLSYGLASHMFIPYSSSADKSIVF